MGFLLKLFPQNRVVLPLLPAITQPLQLAVIQRSENEDIAAVSPMLARLI